jgi:hypothetical protein
VIAIIPQLYKSVVKYRQGGTMKDIEVKPCPFCGQVPIVKTRGNGEISVECSTRYGCPMSAGWSTLELWNQQAGVERATKLLDDLLVLFALYDKDYNIVDEALKAIAVSRKTNPAYPITVALAQFMQDKGLI